MLVGLFEKVVRQGSIDTVFTVVFRTLDQHQNVAYQCELDVEECANKEDIGGALNVSVFAVVAFGSPPDLRYGLIDWRRA